MPGAGKSSVGVILAKALGYEFIDTDLVIQHREKRLLREIIADEGNEGFLAIENEVNATLEADESVIAPGPLPEAVCAGACIPPRPWPHRIGHGLFRFLHRHGERLETRRRENGASSAAGRLASAGVRVPWPAEGKEGFRPVLRLPESTVRRARDKGERKFL